MHERTKRTEYIVQVIGYNTDGWEEHETFENLKDAEEYVEGLDSYKCSGRIIERTIIEREL